MRYGTLTLSILFQSTLSMRRATRDTLTVLGYVQISIHALHEESDYFRPLLPRHHSNFNPRSP